MTSKYEVYTNTVVAEFDSVEEAYAYIEEHNIKWFELWENRYESDSYYQDHFVEGILIDSTARLSF